MKRDFLEEDMYEHISTYFLDLGYVVHGEVKSCDMTATKGDRLIVFEFKKSLSLELLIQGVKRQKISDLTYLCVPRPLKFSYNSKFKDILYLLKRLQLGLIFVDMNKERSGSIEIILDPTLFDMAQSKKYHKKKREGLLKEISLRKTSINKGGSTRKKLMTAYREDSLRLLHLAFDKEFISPKDGVSIGILKSQSILRNNYYNWFTKLDRGKYSLSDEGKSAYISYKDVIDTLSNLE